MGDEICLCPSLDSGQRYCPHPCHGEGKDRRGIQMIWNSTVYTKVNHVGLLVNQRFVSSLNEATSPFFGRFLWTCQPCYAIPRYLDISSANWVNSSGSHDVKCLDFQFFETSNYILIIPLFWNPPPHFQPFWLLQVSFRFLATQKLKTSSSKVKELDGETHCL